MKIRYSEMFYSFQGEAELAGVPAVWLRFFGCNLECAGFGQKDPTDPTTYVLPYQDFDLTNITKNEELPVWQTGCDSSYSWSSRYKHLAHDGTAAEIAQRLIDLNKSEFNPEGKFTHPKTGQETMVCFTGGEPMLYQLAMIEILRELAKLENMPKIVTIETNATRPIGPELDKYLEREFRPAGGTRWHWAMSPKLHTVSGEQNVIIPKIIGSYAGFGLTHMYYERADVTSVLKFVCNGTKENWEELDFALEQIRTVIATHEQNMAWYTDRPSLQGLDIMWSMPPIWIMPVGARAEEQGPEFLGPLCREAMRRGYNVAMRTQIFAFGNVIGS